VGDTNDPASIVAGTRVLVTGAGGPAAVAFMQSAARAGVDVCAVDIDPYAAGLYLVDSTRRALVPRGDAPEFVDALLDACKRWDIQVFVPTVDTELAPTAARLDEFAAIRTVVLAQSAATLDRCLDKWTLIQHCAPHVPVPHTVLLDERFEIGADIEPPFIVKPRRGSGSRGVAVINKAGDLHDVPRDGSYVVQQLLPGREHSLDVLAYRDGTIAAVVPRTRLKTDSGIAVTGCVEVDPELIEYGRAVAAAVGLTSVANVQVKQDDAGRPRLLEVNPRFPGSMPLTVASGVDMPVLALADALGAVMPKEVPFVPLAMVRTWTETFFDPAEMMTPALDGVSS
jgi:carbamoyl-phosphate synthase large subunit